jgi:tRNA (mo5U34)-methyltransferase
VDRAPVRDLGPWYQDVELVDGVSTKSVAGAAAFYPGVPIPLPLWRAIAPSLPSLVGKRVLDIGCNAGYMSFACKRLGAAYVLGVDDDSGADVSFIEQAEFCRDVLGLDVEFQRTSFLNLEPHEPFDLVLFCGVLYHLENWADGLDKLLELVRPNDGLIVLETAVADRTQTTYGSKTYRGDPTTFFVPSRFLLEAILRERGFHADAVVALEDRAIAYLRTGGPGSSGSYAAR